MKLISISTLTQYLAAFASGYIGALLPVLATGDLPSQKAYIAAIAVGALATGLFHCPGPTQKA